MDATIAVWSLFLRTRYSFAKSVDPHDPYVKTMDTFQSFTDRVISALRNDDTVGPEIIKDGMLDNIYHGLPSFFLYDQFRDWVKDGTLKHPYRRSIKQNQFLWIVDSQEANPSSNLVHMVRAAVNWLSKWEHTAYDTRNLLKDPDTLFFFRYKSGIKTAKWNEDDFGESCLICANNFDADQHIPQRTPCGHYQCRECFWNYLSHTPTEYKCSFCRACLVCGENNCQHHTIEHDEAPPYPLGEFLREGNCFCEGPCKAGEPLCGLTPRRYWYLREESRKDRVTLRKITWLLSDDLAPEHYSQVVEEYRDLWKTLRNRIKNARQQQIIEEDEERIANMES